MAIDNTPPRLKLIVTIAIITIVTLIGVNFALDSYFAIMTDIAVREKMAPTTERNEQEAAEKKALRDAPIPIDRAMAELGKGARAAAIAPRPSDDVGPMTGWSQRPKPAPTADMIAPAAPADAVAPEEGDAGAAAETADAGAAPAPEGAATPTTEAGADAGQADADGSAGQANP